MKFIKPLLIAVVFLSLLITLISLLMPSTVMVARTVLIDAPPAKVFATIDDMNSWPAWFTPLKEKKIVSADNSTHSIQWESDNEMNKIQLKDDSRFLSHFTLERKNENNIDLFFSTDSIEAVQSLQLEMRTVRKLKWYPWEKFSGIFEDNVSGPAYEATLKSLKAFIENRGN